MTIMESNPPSGPSGMDLLAIPGQSNASGKRPGDTPTDTTIASVGADRIYLYTLGNKWFLPAFDPISTTEDDYGGSAYTSIWAAGERPQPSFGLFAAETWARLKPNSLVGIVPIAKGGSSLESNAPSGSLSTIYGAGLDRLTRAKKHGTIKGFLFSQGETDARDEQEAEQWSDRFSLIVENWRKHHGAQVPVVFTQLGDDPNHESYPAWQTVRTQQALALSSIKNCFMVVTTGLAKIDGLHYTPDSQRTLGGMMATALYSLVARQQLRRANR